MDFKTSVYGILQTQVTGTKTNLLGESEGFIDAKYSSNTENVG